MRIAVTWVLVTGLLNAQQAAKIDFTCTPPEVEEFGLTCSPEQPCPVYLELSAADSTIGRLLVTGNLHTASVTLYSILLVSDDGGGTWTEPQPRIKSAALEQIQFIDLQYGWIGGHLIQNLPRDPFLLVTTNGGKTWNRKPVSEESRVGAIERFWFESRNSGALIVDLIHPNENGARHERYQTMTGGDSWALEEVSSKELQLKRGPSGEPAWRVRADGGSKTFRIEKNLGAGEWQHVAAFPIEVGSCKGE
jgi:hypothetical protein